MAGNPNESFVETAFKELAECPVCFDICIEPKILPCLHSFCLKCLTRYGEDKKPGEMLACPTCRQEFQVPRGGYSALQANIFVNRIKELYQTSVPRSGQPIALCEACGFGNDGETKSADVEDFCLECQQRLCIKCCALHKQFAVSRMHQIVVTKAGNESALKLLLKTRTSPCELHPNEKVQLYCLTCKQAICLLCFALKHKDHNYESIEEVAEKRSNLMDRDMQAVSERMVVLKNQEAAMEKLNSDLCQSVSSAESQIDQTVHKLIELINSHKNKLIEDLNEMKLTKTKELMLKRQEFESERTLMESFHHFASMLKENGTYVEVACFSDDTHQKARQLLEKESAVLPPKSAIEIRFQTSDAVSELLTKTSNLIGTLSFDLEEGVSPAKFLLKFRNLSVTTPAISNKCITKSFVTRILGTGSILGITVFQGQLFVCRLRSSNVDVFSTSTYKKVSTFTVKGLTDPSDMTSCFKNSCIYINGQQDSCIFKIGNKGNIMDQWKMTDKPFRISVDNKGCVTVTFREALRLGVYAPNGSLLMNVSLPSDMKSPRNAFRVTDDIFVACHGELGEPFHRVCELGPDGKITRWYGGAEGSAQTLINVPVHMIRVSEERYLVADLNNHRVHLIENFRLVTHLLTSDDRIRVPRKLELCDDKLFVAQDDGSILVFTVTL